MNKDGQQVNQFGQFKQLIVGAGSSIFKALGAWIWAGSTTPANATFKIYLPTGELTTTGTINATGGTISGNLTVTGSLFSDDGSGFQTKLISGGLIFLKSSSQKGFIKTATGGNGLTIGSDNIFFTDNSSHNLVSIDSASNLNFSNNSQIHWPGGRSLTADSSKITCSGDFVVTNGLGIGAGKQFSVGGISGGDYDSIGFVTSVDFDGKRLKYRTITTKGGIITNIGNETGWV